VAAAIWVTVQQDKTSFGAQHYQIHGILGGISGYLAKKTEVFPQRNDARRRDILISPGAPQVVHKVTECERGARRVVSGSPAIAAYAPGTASPAAWS
jgi:hypothetical protein